MEAVLPAPTVPTLGHLAPPSWVQTPSRLIIFLCRPISFITSISETRSAKSLSEALSAGGTARVTTKAGCVARGQRQEVLGLSPHWAVWPGKSHLASLNLGVLLYEIGRQIMPHL